MDLDSHCRNGLPARLHTHTHRRAVVGPGALARRRLHVPPGRTTTPMTPTDSTSAASCSSHRTAAITPTTTTTSGNAAHNIAHHSPHAHGRELCGTRADDVHDDAPAAASAVRTAPTAC